MNNRRRSTGVTLVEAVVFIIVVSIGVLGILSAFNTTIRSSADPQVQKQVLAIAESLLEEVELMPFTYCDPDDPNAATATSTSDCTLVDTGESRGSATKPFDNVNDYHGFSMNGIRAPNGDPVSGLELYNASVTVQNFAFGGIAASEALHISVLVTGPSGATATLHAVRTRFSPRL
jgi:MSHA pilin protein MshD